MYIVALHIVIVLVEFLKSILSSFNKSIIKSSVVADNGRFLIGITFSTRWGSGKQMCFMGDENRFRPDTYPALRSTQPQPPVTARLQRKPGNFKAYAATSMLRAVI
jgi:hypothetical protein